MTFGFIIGFGFVGKATAKSFGVNKYLDLKDGNITLADGAHLDYCFICLPTPTSKTGRQTRALSVIRGYIKRLTQLGFKGIFVIRSTVLPGTCRALAREFSARIASCPEILSEATWAHDALHPGAVIVGADDPATRKQVMDLWRKIPCDLRISTDTVTAETLKYAFNTFFLTKIIWANQFYDFCRQNGADYDVIRDALTRHPWGSRHHFQVVHKGGRGGGGHCLPKDIKVFSKYSHLKLLKLVDSLNDSYLHSTHKS